MNAFSGEATEQELPALAMWQPLSRMRGKNHDA